MTYLPEPTTADEAMERARSRVDRHVQPVTIPTPRGKAAKIIATVAAETRVPVSVILGPGRSSPIVAARWEAIRRVAMETGWSLCRIGKIFNRDHTSILHALRRMGIDYRSAEASGPRRAAP